MVLSLCSTASEDSCELQRSVVLRRLGGNLNTSLQFSTAEMCNTPSYCSYCSCNVICCWWRYPSNFNM